VLLCENLYCLANHWCIIICWYKHPDSIPDNQTINDETTATRSKSTMRCVLCENFLCSCFVNCLVLHPLLVRAVDSIPVNQNNK
jgi:hypothetical protein